MKKIFILLTIAFVIAGCNTKNKQQDADISTPTELAATSTPEAPVLGIKEETDMTEEKTPEILSAKKAIIATSKGNITVELFPEEAPNTVNNFLTKSKDSYYKDLTFHRVEDWVIQGGDPLGTGTGGGKMPTELNEVTFVEGSLGVARGPDIEVSNDSQFFVCTKDCSWLDGQYTNFGKVTEGMDVVKQIAIGDKIIGITFE